MPDASVVESFDFSSLEPIAKPVTMPDGRKFILTEVSSGANSRFKDALLSGIKIGPDGKPIGADGMSRRELQLVADCLVPLDKNGNPKLDNVGNYTHVSLSYVEQLHDRITSRLLVWIKENSEAFKSLTGVMDNEDDEGTDSPKGDTSNDSE